MDDVGRGYGCCVAIVVATMPILPLAFALGWSGAHCNPIPSCQRSAEWHTGLAFCAISLFAGLLGYAVRTILNGMAAKRADGGYAAAFARTANALSVVVVLAALALLYTVASL